MFREKQSLRGTLAGRGFYFFYSTQIDSHKKRKKNIGLNAYLRFLFCSNSQINERICFSCLFLVGALLRSKEESACSRLEMVLPVVLILRGKKIEAQRWRLVIVRKWIRNLRL